MKNSNKRERLAKERCGKYLEELSQLNLVNQELKDRLDSYGDIPGELFKKPAKEYSKAQKDFALTLHLQSPKAYLYLRNTTKVPLPSPRTLRRWLESIDASPGINMAVIQDLQKKKQDMPDNYTKCCFMMDAMSIRKHIQYIKHTGKFVGHVNLGNDADDDNTNEAKEVLVFMLVGLTGRWKAPIAYFLTAGLSADSQKELLLHCIQTLSDHGFEIKTLTLDGHPSNVAMVKMLGASVDVKNTVPYIICNGQKIFVFFDACHMVKLIRNTLQAYGTLTIKGEQISWSFITKLHQTQEELGLHLANKLSRKHVEFHQQKMKVSLATQVFSSSVANALRTMQTMDSEFADCGPTAEFIDKIDKLFDVFNSKSLTGRGYKCAIQATNFQERKEFLVNTRQYLLNIKTSDGTPLIYSRRGMCIQGFVVLIDSLVGLLPQQKFILTYKMSQDHLELFFNAVRRSGGWNNNPTAVTFTGVFRKIISHCGSIQVSTFGNCQKQDDTEILQLCTSTYQPPAISSNNPEDEVDPFLNDELAEHDHCYYQGGNTPLIENILVYVAGWVVRKLSKSLHCTSCRLALISDVPSEMYKHSYTLLNLKQMGGLVVPSEATIKIIISAEKHLRHITNIHKINRSLSLLQLQSCVMAEVDVEILNMDQHALDTQDGIDNHAVSLLKAIVETFFHLRQNHITSLHNIQSQGRSVRHTLNKTILCKGH